MRERANPIIEVKAKRTESGEVVSDDDIFPPLQTMIEVCFGAE